MLIPARHLSNGSEHLTVEDEHDDAWYVERCHRRADEEVRVVKGTDGRRQAPLFRVVHTERYWRRHSHRDDPCQSDQRQVGSSRTSLLGVAYRLRHSYEPDSDI